MITRTYKPKITEQDIQLALSTEDAEYSEETKADLAKGKKSYRKQKIVESAIFLFVGVGVFFVGRLFSANWIGTIMTLAGVFFAVFAPIYLVVMLVQSFRSPSQKDPEEVMREFIKNDGNYAKALELVTPSVLGKISVDTLSVDWQTINQEISEALKFQETATCAQCNERARGL